MRACKISFCFHGSAGGRKHRGVRKLVTRKYPYLVYYTVDEAAGEIVILNVKHPARRREHEDM
jgi:plasmid stabilization system protein ParE